MKRKLKIKRNGNVFDYEMKADNRTETNKLGVKEVLDLWDSMKQYKEQALENLKKLEVEKKKIQTSMEAVDYDMSKFRDHIEFCQDAEKSKLKGLIEEVKDECLDKVKEGFKLTADLKPSDIRAGVFVLFQKYIATHEKISGKVNQKVWKELIYGEDALINLNDTDWVAKLLQERWEKEYGEGAS